MDSPDPKRPRRALRPERGDLHHAPAPPSSARPSRPSAPRTIPVRSRRSWSGTRPSRSGTSPTTTRIAQSGSCPTTARPGSREPQLRRNRGLGPGARLLRRRRPVAPPQGPPPTRSARRHRRRHRVLRPRVIIKRRGQSHAAASTACSASSTCSDPGAWRPTWARPCPGRCVLERDRAPRRAHPRWLCRGLRVDAASYPARPRARRSRTAAPDALDRAIALPRPVADWEAASARCSTTTPSSPASPRAGPHRRPAGRRHRRPGPATRRAPPDPHHLGWSWKEPRALIALAVVAGVPASRISAALNRRGRGI